MTLETFSPATVESEDMKDCGYPASGSMLDPACFATAVGYRPKLYTCCFYGPQTVNAKLNEQTHTMASFS